jgi:hypothetical protein
VGQRWGHGGGVIMSKCRREDIARLVPGSVWFENHHPWSEDEPDQAFMVVLEDPKMATDYRGTVKIFIHCGSPRYTIVDEWSIYHVINWCYCIDE